MDRDSEAGTAPVLPEGGRGPAPSSTAPLVDNAGRSSAAAALPGYGRVRCPSCKHSTFDREQIETGWCLWCKAYTFVGRDGVDRRGTAAQVNAPVLVYSGAVWQHDGCGGRNFDELYLFQDRPGHWALTCDPLVRAGEEPSIPRCGECGSRIRYPFEVSGYWALVVAPFERAGAAERVAMAALPFPFLPLLQTDTVPPGEIPAPD